MGGLYLPRHLSNGEQVSQKSSAIISIFGLMILLTVAILLWQRNAFNKHPSGSYRKIKDQTARTVAIPERPQRILSLSSSATDTLVRLGQTHRLCAVDEYNRNVPGIGTAMCISKGSAISREQIQSLKVDMAFIWWFQDDAAHLLDDISVPVVRIRTGRAGELSETIRLVGECINFQNDADHMAQSLVEWVAKNAPTPATNCPRVYIEFYAPLKTIGKDSYTNDMIEMAGGQNIANAKQGRVLFSVEGLIAADPDIVMVVGDTSALQAAIQRPEMSNLRAVREKRAFAVSPSWLIPGAGLPVAVENFRAIISGNI